MVSRQRSLQGLLLTDQTLLDHGSPSFMDPSVPACHPRLRRPDAAELRGRAIAAVRVVVHDSRWSPEHAVVGCRGSQPLTGGDTDRMGTGGRLAEYFDGWYADMVVSPAKDEILRRHLGLPPYLLSTSFFTWDGIAEATDALGLALGATLLDLACGRGGYGLEIAARTGARLIGVDISAEAVRQATEQARRLGRAAGFRSGALTATGLESGSVEAVLCVDAIQFAADRDAAYRELRRVLVPRGRVYLTCWEPIHRGDERLPDRLRWVGLGAGLEAAGFDDVQVRERPDWRAAERTMWEEAALLDPREDRALQSFHAEALRSLETFDLVRRVMATATAP